jgi:DNA helicase II / ATP-dependent DNA helicase PcrA
MDFLESLNPAQQGAVLQTDGPVMIIAGAGSGKTRVLTYRIAHLIKKGVDPYNILSLTFTNKAAKEMKNRIEVVVGPNARNLWMGTFHSIFARILRQEAPLLGFPANFTIYDTDDSKSLIRSIVKELHIDDKLYKDNAVLSRISWAKNKLVSYQEYNRNPAYMADDETAQKPHIGKIYQIYQERCFKAGAMDFDDLLFNTSILLRNFPEILNKYQDRFHYVMIDEFQDTNLCQYYITRKLSARRRNICVVGDDAQSIYAFRGADIQNILNFEKDYAELKVFKLEQNYRSTKTIVQAANEIIAHNRAQLKKNVWTDNKSGNLINLLIANSDNEEAKMVSSSIFDFKMQNARNHSDFAILYRTNSQSRSIEEALRKMNMPYKIFGGVSFYQRKEIKDLLAYLRLTVNPNDEEAFKRVINYPKRGIGDTTVQKVVLFAIENNINLWESMDNAHSYLPARAAGGIDDFVTMMKNFRLATQTKDAFDAASQIAKESRLMAEMHADKSIEGVSRYENLQELLNGIKEFVSDQEREDKSLGAFLQDVALLTNADEVDEKSDYISLMTIHSSKGLEFKYVYIVGVEEDLFPSQMMLASRADLEEERRLFYVAITRAETQLVLSYALTRFRFGKLKSCEPSRFLKEINPIFLNKPVGSRPELTNTINSDRSFSSNYSSLLTNYKSRNTVGSLKKIEQRKENFESSNNDNLQEGQKVEHPSFGMGLVLSVDRSNLPGKAVIGFESVGEKTLLLSFAKLKIHS